MKYTLINELWLLKTLCLIKYIQPYANTSTIWKVTSIYIGQLMYERGRACVCEVVAHDLHTAMRAKWLGTCSECWKKIVRDREPHNFKSCV